jgi:hypothetical protein
MTNSAVQQAYGIDHGVSDAEMLALAESWRPFRTWVAVMMRACLPRARHNEAVPEGDTVWRAGRRLNDVFAGQVLTRCEFRVPALATTDLTRRASSWPLTAQKPDESAEIFGVLLHDHSNDPNNRAGRHQPGWHLIRLPLHGLAQSPSDISRFPVNPEAGVVWRWIHRRRYCVDRPDSVTLLQVANVGSAAGSTD